MRSPEGCCAVKVYSLYFDRFLLDSGPVRLDEREKAEFRGVDIANEVS
jgi:hypothetical protein